MTAVSGLSKTRIDVSFPLTFAWLAVLFCCIGVLVNLIFSERLLLFEYFCVAVTFAARDDEDLEFGVAMRLAWRLVVSARFCHTVPFWLRVVRGKVEYLLFLVSVRTSFSGLVFGS